MRKKSDDALHQEHTLLDKVIESSWYGKVAAQGQQLLIGGLVLLAALFVLYKLGSRQSMNAEVAYAKGVSDYAAFSKAMAQGQSEEGATYLKELETLLYSQPSLQPKYDGPIAQTLLADGQPQEAFPYMGRLLARTEKNQLPAYRAFALTAQALAQGDKERALKESLALKELLMAEAGKEADTANSLLFAYTLVQIAFLEQAAGNGPGELKAWQEFKGYAGLAGSDEVKGNPFAKQSFLAIVNLFSEGKVSLSNYISVREKELAGKG